MNVAQLRELKIELGLTNEMIAEASGVPLSTVKRIFSGLTKAPRKHSLVAIQRVLTDAGREESLPQGLKRAVIPEEDVLSSVPKEQSMEWIDGRSFEMGTTSFHHQLILGELYMGLRAALDGGKEPCDVYMGPCDVLLDGGNDIVVRPDLFVYWGGYHANRDRCEGSPDLVVEILSGKSRGKDMILKLYTYERAGVREYWIVDPKSRSVTVHLFSKEEYNLVRYGFEERIPVGITGGKHSIDFSRVNKKLSRWGL